RDHLQLPGRADHLRRVTRGSTFRVARAHATAAVVVLLIFACHPLVPVGAADPLGEARRMLLEAKPLASRSKYDVLVAIAGVQAGAGDVTGALARAADLDELERRWWALKDIAEAQARTGDLAGALHTANVRQKPGWRDVTLQAVALARAESGDITA